MSTLWLNDIRYGKYFNDEEANKQQYKSSFTEYQVLTGSCLKIKYQIKLKLPVNVCQSHKISPRPQ